MAPTFEAYRAELLRWNRQINLLSRRQPEATADALIGQCVEAFGVWWTASGAELAAGGALRVFDLGSGGGLPAFVWLSLLGARGVACEATLFEPRAKRAWFLERLRLLPGAPAYTVLAARWGAAAAAAGSVGEAPILFTLKALRLSETAVLGGLAGFGGAGGTAPGVSVELVRFQPGAGVTAMGLARDLEIPAPATRFRADALDFESRDCRFLPPARPGPRGAGLLVSRHGVVGPAA